MFLSSLSGLAGGWLSQAGLSWVVLLHAVGPALPDSSFHSGWLEVALGMLIQEPRPGEVAIWKGCLALQCHPSGDREAQKDQLLAYHLRPRFIRQSQVPGLMQKSSYKRPVGGAAE